MSEIVQGVVVPARQWRATRFFACFIGQAEHDGHRQAHGTTAAATPGEVRAKAMLRSMPRPLAAE
ncbi:hypothetical protein [Bosea sp. 124]|uniref:hypothetical protein n=1 Tax=Bosea sp. 124 TaxID=2135642 RepID=UPI000D396A0B|nr:hypothetical protein [Bosea sp. 124]